MPYSAKAIANAYLDIAKKNGAGLTPMKLQKLVYFAQGWYLALMEEKLINEQVEAWKYGPVWESLYHEFKHFGNSTITHPATETVMQSGEKFLMKLKKVDPPKDPEAIGFLEAVWDAYGAFTSIQLSNLTHKEGTPWEETWKPGLPKNTDIPEDSIKQFFQAKIEPANAEGV